MIKNNYDRFVSAIDRAVMDTIRLRDVEIKKYKFIESGLYVK